MNKLLNWGLNFNKIIRTFVMVDFFFNSAFGIFAPVFAIFVLEQVPGSSAKVVGLAASVYWIVKSIFQLPIARFLDKTDGERDDFWALFLGYFFASFVPLAYLFVSQSWHLYVIQGFLGFCMAWAVPSWYGIFTRHLDRGHISFEWSLQSVFAVGIATAAATAIGGYIVDAFGFRSLFIVASALSFIATFLLLLVRKDMRPKVKTEHLIPERPKSHS